MNLVWPIPPEYYWPDHLDVGKRYLLRYCPITMLLSFHKTGGRAAVPRYRLAFLGNSLVVRGLVMRSYCFLADKFLKLPSLQEHLKQMFYHIRSVYFCVFVGHRQRIWDQLYFCERTRTFEHGTSRLMCSSSFHFSHTECGDLFIGILSVFLTVCRWKRKSRTSSVSTCPQLGTMCDLLWRTGCAVSTTIA